MVGALVIDQIIKTIFIKLDGIFEIKDTTVIRELDGAKDKVKLMKQKCSNNLDMFVCQFEITEKRYQDEIEKLNAKIELQSKMINDL